MSASAARPPSLSFAYVCMLEVFDTEPMIVAIEARLTWSLPSRERCYLCMAVSGTDTSGANARVFRRRTRLFGWRSSLAT